MISSFFGKTKPINYIVLAIFLFLFYFSNVFLGLGDQKINDVIPIELLTFVVLLLGIFIINQMVRTEKITDFNSYTILFFVLLVTAFSENLQLKNAIFTNFFLLLALWRLLSIKSIRNVKHKIFDASLLIAVASLFYDWALVFLLLVFVVINLYDRKTFKNWLVPFVGVATIFILTFTILKLNDSLDFFREHYQFSLGIFKTDSFFEVLNVKALIYILFALAVAFVVFLRLRNVGGGKLLQLRVIFLAFVLGVAITLLTPADESPVLITFFPASVFMANYFEAIKKAKHRESILIICTVLSLLLFALQMNH
ncbi:DUF6427 family protein [Flagellimonas baculiformis]|uniref:DUF6427 family protein n=1 Tax=Flagellimonas baculiformis TaxID=3067310 RepID=UPI00296EC608|nr:DUF6427 family protein [Muricauda sp. D6]